MRAIKTSSVNSIKRYIRMTELSKLAEVPYATLMSAGRTSSNLNLEARVRLARAIEEIISYLENTLEEVNL